MIDRIVRGRRLAVETLKNFSTRKGSKDFTPARIPHWSGKIGITFFIFAILGVASICVGNLGTGTVLILTAATSAIPDARALWNYRPVRAPEEILWSFVPLAMILTALLGTLLHNNWATVIGVIGVAAWSAVYATVNLRYCYQMSFLDDLLDLKNPEKAKVAAAIASNRQKARAHGQVASFTFNDVAYKDQVVLAFGDDFVGPKEITQEQVEEVKVDKITLEFLQELRPDDFAVVSIDGGVAIRLRQK